MSYEENFKHKEDFRVRYTFYTREQGGRTIPPYQGYRSDFWYPHKDNMNNKLFMIYPEFEDENGDIILEKEKSVPWQGTARMWILNTPMRAYHQTRITKGAKGYFMEGPNKVAECEVIEIIDLLNNPTE